MEVHVHFSENTIFLLQHGLRTHDLADAVVRPVEERLELRLAAVVTGAAAENDIVIEILRDQGRVVTGIEQRFVFVVIQHTFTPSAFRQTVLRVRFRPSYRDTRA
jgi:hypothetical protein